METPASAGIHQISIPALASVYLIQGALVAGRQKHLVSPFWLDSTPVLGRDVRVLFETRGGRILRPSGENQIEVMALPTCDIFHADLGLGGQILYDPCSDNWMLSHRCSINMFVC